jgi:hydroxypyruvate isomerase
MKLKSENRKNRGLTRRHFIGGTLAASVAVAGADPLAGLSGSGTRNTGPFKLKYAPHFNMFRRHAGEDLIDQLKFMSDQGFTALEDNGMMSRPVEVQEKIAREMARLGMTMGVFVAGFKFNEKNFVTRDPEIRKMLVSRMRDAVETSKRVNAQWCTVVPGAFDQRLEYDFQMANTIDNLRFCAEVCEPSGLIMVLEPLNWLTNHPGLFLTKIPQAYQICRAVDSPSCKILNDLYHQQVTEGNLIPNIEMAWEEIAYFQVGDNPGRKEPTTGEINYRNIFKMLYQKGYQGIVGMEHGISGKGKAGEQAVIDAYRYCDDFI